MLKFAILAALIQLAPGYNNAGRAGEVVAVQAATASATATVQVKAVDALTVYTNTTAQVVSFETAYALVYTNFDGNAAIETNVMRYVDYDYFKTNGVSKIISGPTRFDMPITNTVITGRAPSAFYAVTNDLATVTTSGHFGSVTTNGCIFGGGILVEGAAEGDTIKLILK